MTPLLPSDWKCLNVSTTNTVDGRDTGKSEIRTDIPVLPDNLKVMYDGSCKNLIEDRQIIKLAKILSEKRDAFAENNLDIGIQKGVVVL